MDNRVERLIVSVHLKSVHRKYAAYQRSIRSPTDQSSVKTSVIVKTPASDKSGINRAEFNVDWKLPSTVAGPPCNFHWTNGATGTNILTATARTATRESAIASQFRYTSSDGCGARRISHYPGRFPAISS